MRFAGLSVTKRHQDSYNKASEDFNILGSLNSLKQSASLTQKVIRLFAIEENRKRDFSSKSSLPLLNCYASVIGCS
ncbi:MAG: hypothetical protein ACFWUD_08050 [Thermocaproicibacter melissae]